VDEGNNWINMTYGPLTLSRMLPTTNAPDPQAKPELIVASALGAAQGAYSITGNSIAVGAGDASAPARPALDFYGQQRPAAGVSIGAVEYIPPAPTLTGINPAQGTRGTSVAVTLTGTDFTVGSTVTVTGGVAASNVTRVSSTTLTATFTIPTSTLPSVQTVTVTSTGGTSGTVNFTIVNPPAPTLTSINPNSGTHPASANATTSVPVTLTGTGFTQRGAAVTVSGGRVNVSNVTVVSDTTIMATFGIQGGTSTATGPRTVTVYNSGLLNPATITFTVK
jgi:hypothetical protein